jgi:hypothetical protein
MYVYSKNFKKKFFFQLTKARGKIFGMKHKVVDRHKDCLNFSPEVKIGYSQGVLDFTYVYI